MISYLEGKLLAKSDDRIVVLAAGVGYEIMLPRAVMPAPRSPPSTDGARIARAIEAKDAKLLCTLDGIGPRKAEKIIASLNGRVGKFALMPEVEGAPAPAEEEDFQTEVIDVLVIPLRQPRTEAQRMVQS